MISDSTFGMIDRFGKVAEKGSTFVLLTLGPTLIVVALVAKIAMVVGGIEADNFSASEFIAVLITGVLLIGFAAALRAYYNKTQREIKKETLRSMKELIEMGMKSKQEDQEAAKEAYKDYQRLIAEIASGAKSGTDEDKKVYTKLLEKYAAGIPPENQ